jgi:hypothetical protein
MSVHLTPGWGSADVPAPVMTANVAARLDAIVRRHGGTPKPPPEKHITQYTPMPPRGMSPHQLPLYTQQDDGPWTIIGDIAAENAGGEKP